MAISDGLLIGQPPEFAKCCSIWLTRPMECIDLPSET
jgi:hypothetical protein